MNKELPKAYNPKEYEDRIYKEWEKSGFFNPDNLDLPKNAPAYTIILPPPNRTGVLHIGHALMLVIQDILTRYHRMKGEKTLWVPGTDHAAIATQSVVEKKLYAEEKKTRHDLGREEFLKRVREFADQSHKTIIKQVKKMGASLDWSREAYTLDETRTRVVNTVFKMMSDGGLIYRGDRVVNWCPRCLSTLADDEVEYKTQKAKLYTFKYSKNFPFAIATTRPETKLGDTAVAVNPKDKRYKKYIGKIYEIDFVGVPLKLKIIADRAVDMGFGIGAVGVTPAHSMVDWQMAQDHNLDIIKVINEDGKIHDDFANYAGKSAEQAREMIVEKLKEQGLLEKEEEMENNLSLCYRCNTPIEPLPSKQWFINVNKKIPKYNKTIKELSIEAVKKGVFGRDKIEIIPERFEKNYFHWMDNLRDWCISRQIWFGHRIPVWYRHVTCNIKHETVNSKKIKITYFVHGTTIDNEKNIASGHYDVELSNLGIEQSKKLRELMKEKKFDVIFCSDLRRAVDSAKLAFSDRGIEIIQDKRLRECDYGDLTRKDIKEYEPIMKERIDRPFFTGESYKDVEKRILEFLEEVKNKYSGKRVAIVAHQGPQLALDVILKGKTWEQAIDEDWRKEKKWQPGWEYKLTEEEIYVGVEPPKEKTNFVFLRGFLRTIDVEDPLNWLNEKLKNKDNFIDKLPNPNNPNLSEQMNFVYKNAKINKNTIVVAHSIGCILAMKLIEERNLKIKKLVLIAPPMQTAKTFDGKVRNEIKDYSNGKFDFEKIKKLVDETVVFYDINDHIILREEPKIIAKKLNAKIIELRAPVSHFNCKECSEILKEVQSTVWVQDEDTLDTWFSSGLWTFSTLANSPDQIKIEDGRLVIDSDDFKTFHPTTVMETGYDILFFWVARMIIMTTYAVGDIPFENVYLHGLVRDIKGRKMSKSLGNAIDPLDVCAKYGTDAVRLSLIIGTTPGNDLNLSQEKIAGFRNFTNKLWNISRYVIGNWKLEIRNLQKKDTECPIIGHSVSGTTLADKWILNKLNVLIKQVSKDLDNYRFSQAGEKLREFTWNDFADWYVEVSKFEKNSEKDKILIIILQDLLKLWHPFMPFVTEAIWKEFNNSDLIIEKWPDSHYLTPQPPLLIRRGGGERNETGERFNDFEIIKNIITAIRAARSQYRIKPSQKIKAVIYAGKNKELIESQIELIKKLRTGIDEIEIKKSGGKIKEAIYLTVNGIDIYLIVPGFNFKAEVDKLKKEIKDQEARIKILEKKLSNKQFIKKAPEQIVKQEKEKLVFWHSELEKLKERLNHLK